MTTVNSTDTESLKFSLNQLIDMTDPIIKDIIEIYRQADFIPSILPKSELSTLFYDLTGRHIIWSYGFSKALEGAYNKNRDALRKALIALLKRSISYFSDQISKYPDLQGEYEKKKAKNTTLIAKIQQLW